MSAPYLCDTCRKNNDCSDSKTGMVTYCGKFQKSNIQLEKEFLEKQVGAQFSINDGRCLNFTDSELCDILSDRQDQLVEFQQQEKMKQEVLKELERDEEYEEMFGEYDDFE